MSFVRETDTLLALITCKKDRLDPVFAEAAEAAAAAAIGQNN